MSNVIEFPAKENSGFQCKLEHHLLRQQNQIRTLTAFIENELKVKVEEIRFSQNQGKLVIEVLAENLLVIR
jgi:hypothetical protein